MKLLLLLVLLACVLAIQGQVTHVNALFYNPPVRMPTAQSFPGENDCKRSDLGWEPKAGAAFWSVVGLLQPWTCSNRWFHDQANYHMHWSKNTIKPRLNMAGGLQSYYHLDLDNEYTARFTRKDDHKYMNITLVCASNRNFDQDVMWIYNEDFRIISDGQAFCLYVMYEWTWKCNDVWGCDCSWINIHGSGGLAYRRGGINKFCDGRNKQWVLDAFDWFQNRAK